MIDYQVDGDGIATLAWNVTDRPMNVMSAAAIDAMEKCVNDAVADASVKGAIMTSARPEFIVGADLGLLKTFATTEVAMAAAARISAILRKMETSGKPFVAAINGMALGGGYEVALACHHRIMADNPKAQVGLPEVTIGVLPGAGGTQRLPRMIGIKNALPYILDGRKAGPAQALAEGLVDEVVAPDALRARAKEWLMTEGAAHTVQPWDQKGFRFPGGSTQTPAIQQLFAGISGPILAKTQGLYPAPQAALACIYDGCQVDLDSGLRIEQRQFAKLAISPSAKNIIRAQFYSIADANRLSGRPKGVPTLDYSCIGVLGAGMMGAGIAYVAARAGLRVVLLDVTQAAAERGKSYAAGVMEQQVKKGRLSEDQRDKTLELIQTTSTYDDLKPCQLVIEAVFEDRSVKAEATRQAEAVLAPNAIFATNTSTLPITGLAEVSARPDKFVGMHFFSPVDRMPLVEVIRGAATGEATIAHALDLVKRLRMTPIVVNDCRAFYCNRAFAYFPFEAMAMLNEGVNPVLIENVGRQAGMPMPPFALVDEVTIELLYKAHKQEKADLGADFVAGPEAPVMAKMVDQLDRIGKKTGRGFYDYASDGSKRLWPGLAEHFPLTAEQPSADEVRKRMMYLQSVEAARCVAEGIVSARDADVGSLLGWGFPMALGGAISQIDTVGAAEFIKECDRMAASYGERFAVPQQLRDMAERGERYFD